MRRWCIVGLLFVPVAVGCGKPAALQPGDALRPRLALAPAEPWPEGCRAAIGMLVEVQRLGQSQAAFLREEDVARGAEVMRAKVTFLAGAALVGEPLEVPFVRDC